MHCTCRSTFGALVFVGVALVAPNMVNAQGTSEDGEIWVTAQNTNELKILSGMGGIETVVLPAGAARTTRVTSLATVPVPGVGHELRLYRAEKARAKQLWCVFRGDDLIGLRS